MAARGDGVLWGMKMLTNAAAATAARPANPHRALSSAVSPADFSARELHPSQTLFTRGQEKHFRGEGASGGDTERNADGPAASPTSQRDFNPQP